MKKLFTLLLVLVATTALWAHDFEVDGIYYNILTDNEVEVTGGSTKYSGSVTIPASVTYKGTTYSVTSIGKYAFGECFSLTSITIPNSVTEIGDAAFAHCSRLTSVTIPNSVTSIGTSAFGGCSGLIKPVYNAHCFAYLPTSYEGAYTIPEGIKQIAGSAFGGCFVLTSITIPNSVTSIGEWAFQYCSSLTSVTIGSGVTSIGNYAFYNCRSLTSIESLAETPPTLGTKVFYSVSTQIPVYVPCGSVSAYQSAEGWNAFTNIQCGSNEPSTALENTHSQSPMANRQKLLRDGQLIILRDGKSYSVMGQEL